MENKLTKSHFIYYISIIFNISINTFKYVSVQTFSIFNNVIAIRFFNQIENKIITRKKIVKP